MLRQCKGNEWTRSNGSSPRIQMKNINMSSLSAGFIIGKLDAQVARQWFPASTGQPPPMRPSRNIFETGSKECIEPIPFHVRPWIITFFVRFSGEESTWKAFIKRNFSQRGGRKEREREKKTLLIKANDVRNKLCTKRWMVDKDRGRKLRKRWRYRVEDLFPFIAIRLIKEIEEIEG